MLTIIRPFNLFFSISGSQRYDRTKEYKKTIFCVELFIENNSLLYNSLSGELLLLDTTEKKDWNHNISIRDELVKKWFLVPFDFDEIEYCNQIKTVARRIKQKNTHINQYTVFTTTTCNARCFYCFEKGQKQITMNEHTAHDVAKWMIKHAEDHAISIQWFGGEPLCNYKVIDIICDELRTNSVRFSSTIISNAYLFDEIMVKKAKDEWNLQSATISLDGTEQKYNEIKAFIDKTDNAYQRVIGNIERLLKAGIQVTIRLNMDASNVEELKKLSFELHKCFGTYNNIEVRCEFLKEYASQIHHFDDNYAKLESLEKIRRILDEKGIRQKQYLNKELKCNSCMADNPQAVTILPDGRIGKCEEYGDSQEIGSIYIDEMNKERIESWKELLPSQKECHSCAYYPLCYRLKKCNGFDKECDSLYRTLFDIDIKDRIYNTYNLWKNKMNSEKE